MYVHTFTSTCISIHHIMLLAARNRSPKSCSSHSTRSKKYGQKNVLIAMFTSRKAGCLETSVACLVGLLERALKWLAQNLYWYWKMEFASMIASCSGHVCTFYFHFDLSSTLPVLPPYQVLNKSYPIISCILFNNGVFLFFCLNNTDMSYTFSIQIIHDPIIS